MVTRVQIALSLTASAALVGAALAQSVAEGGTKFATTMTGANECNAAGTCNLGDPDGTGRASITVNPGQSRICYELTVSNIDTPTAAHIHSAPTGIAGPVIVPLSAPSGGTSSGCVDVNRDLVDAIRKAPQGYYVNVHTAAFPAGAIRGQLSK
jgi:hypothetical protein